MPDAAPVSPATAAAAAKAAPAPEPLTVREDPRFDRAPMMRETRTIIVPQASGQIHRIAIRELRDGGEVSITEGGICRSVSLNVRELRRLAEIANRVARRVTLRPEYEP
jgi:hypothetical protein